MRKEQKGIRIIHKNNQQNQRGRTKNGTPSFDFYAYNPQATKTEKYFLSLWH